MSGTLHEVRGELRRVYGLQTVRIPTHRPVKRTDLGARYFWRAEDKWCAVAARAQTLAQSGRPVLVGTCALEDSEKLSALLTAAGVAHRLLNARQDEEEAAIVAQAGVAGQITIATNMAGRGTDIVLGPGVAEKGGLHVIVCERNAARRIDRQLRGRAARQGDPGSFEFFESLEDERVLTYFKRSVILFSRFFPRHGETCPAFIGGSLGRLAQRLTEWRHRGMRRALQQLDEARTTMMAFSGRAE
jgi:preprotein translocase subunit SecA